MSKLVKLKAVTIEEEKYHYILLPLKTKEDGTLIKETKELPEYLHSLLKEENYSVDTVNAVLAVGDLTSFRNTDKLVYRFPQRTVDIRNKRAPIYRDYCKTAEKQMEINWLVNVAEDSRTSWKTAILACGSKIGIVLKMHIPKK